jgi:hypothetical protein
MPIRPWRALALTSLALACSARPPATAPDQVAASPGSTVALAPTALADTGATTVIALEGTAARPPADAAGSSTPATSATAGRSTATAAGATGIAAALPPPIAGPPATPLEVAEAQALTPGSGTPLLPADATPVDPAATFRVVLKGRLPDARLSLLEGDAMVPSAGAREAGLATTLSLQPTAPLRPGSRYRLRVDGATRREITAADGSRRAPVEWVLQATGEPPADRSRAKPKKKAR